ncbi:MAG: outer membrane lipoprotein carrier protein LolA [Treponema sp.]|nr:outer membrane lipoprotein carrier protein LolA [Treponema sp.]
MKNVIFFGIIFAMVTASVSAENITTASEYFNSVSEFYGTIKDFEASVEITAAKKEMAGDVSFKRPDLLRIDFTNPAGQVIAFNGSNLTIYLPEASAILNQEVQSDGSSAGGAGLATPEGLSLMKRYYTIAYEIGQDPVPLEDGSDEKVIKFILYRRNSSEAFKNIKLAVTPETKLIRRIEATTSHGEVFTFDFHDYKLNQDIPDQRFIYDAPSSANNYNNFLFSE